MILIPKHCHYCGAKLPPAKLANKYCSKQCSMRAVNYKAGRAVDMTPALQLDYGRLSLLLLITIAASAAATVMFCLAFGI